jgi:hypothetical protein
MLKNLWDKIWKDNNGKIVIWQMPNWFLIGWAILTFISLLFTGRTADIFSWAASASLIYWCWLEITQGVNYFRRALGLFILYYSIVTVLKSF